MPRLRQLPQVYLRGSLANETMRYLSPDEKRTVDTLTREIAGSPVLANHRAEFITKLGQTIAGDYRDSRRDAEQEYYVAVWRAVVHLIYHSEYSYRCTHCSKTSYTTQKYKLKAFDRRYPHCPHCEVVRITDPGDSGYKAGEFVNIHKLQDTILSLEFQHGQQSTGLAAAGGLTPQMPAHESPIVSIKGQKKVQDHEKVLNDPEQLCRFFSEFVWNYFRQIIRENEIKYHQKEIKRKLVGPADIIAVEEICSYFTSQKIKFTYHERGNPYEGYYHISICLLELDPSVSVQIATLMEKYKKYRVSIKLTDTEIMVKETLNARVAEVEVMKPQMVQVMTTPVLDDDGNEMTALDAHQHRIKGGMAMQDGMVEVETTDLFDTIKQDLCDGARQVFDIYLQQGDAYDQYLEYTKDLPKGQKPSLTHIARVLDVSPTQVAKWKSDIEMYCLRHGIGCED